MGHDHREILDLLRLQLTAVHQQFIHVLALKVWGEEAIARRIAEVDNEDFPCAMQILDDLARAGAPVRLGPQAFAPGTDVQGVLRAERRIERAFQPLLCGLGAGSDFAPRIARARAPRTAYRAWLDAGIGPGAGPPRPPTEPAMAALMARLVELIEQAMIHAFQHWQAGDRPAADRAWEISGAAMLYATALVRRAALSAAVPAPGPVGEIACLPDGLADAPARDRTLAGAICAAARAAADAAEDPATARLCRRIADECVLIAEAPAAADFPAELGRSAAFTSFAATRDRFL